MVFVTGGTGLIGSHLLIELTQEYDKITAIFRNDKKIEIVKKCFHYYLGEKYISFFNRIQWKKCDIQNIPELEEAMKGNSIIYHCAGLVSSHKKEYSKLIQVNRYGTSNMVNVALAQKVDKFCFVSSSAALGKKDIPPEVEVDENGKWQHDEKKGGYSISKYSAEKEVWRGINEGLKAVIVNPTVVFGAGTWKEGSLSIFKRVAKGTTYYTPGANGFVDARDVAKIMVLLMKNNCFNERYICVGENASFKCLFQSIAKAANVKVPTKEASGRLLWSAYYFLTFISTVTFSKPLLTRPAIRSSLKQTKYSNKKVVKQLDYTFYSLSEMIENTIKGHIE